MPPVGQVLTEEWGSVDVVVDCLLPSGVIIPLTTNWQHTLTEIKENLWVTAREFPLYEKLKNKSAYHFWCITETGEKADLMDESRRFCDVKPFYVRLDNRDWSTSPYGSRPAPVFHPILKVIERKGDEQERQLNSKIGILLGKSVYEFDALKSSEVSDFRKNKKQMCIALAAKKNEKSLLERLMIVCPPDLAPDPMLPSHLLAKLHNQQLQIRIHYKNVRSLLRIDHTGSPQELIQMYLKRPAITGQSLPNHNDLLLKVYGREEYLFGTYPLAQCMYMRRMLAHSTTPQLILSHTEDVEKLLEFKATPVVPPKHPPKSQGHFRRPAPPAPMPAIPSGGVCLWDLQEEMPYCLILQSISNVNYSHWIGTPGTADRSRLQLRVCIYHGGDTMCSVVRSPEVVVHDNHAEWQNNKLIFEGLALPDIPRMARLCLVLFLMPDRSIKHRNPNKQIIKGMRPLAWVNMPVFDFRGVMQTGPQQLYMWSIRHDDVLSEETLNPIGTVECNPDSDCVCLKFSIFNYNTNAPIYYPPHEEVLAKAAANINFKYVRGDIAQVEINRPDQNRKTITSVALDTNPILLDELQRMVARDALSPLCEQEKETIWGLRYDCLHHFRASLPRLLSCVQWNKRFDVMEVQAILQGWKPLEATSALELLDFRYADNTVRKRAVEWLRDLSDGELKQYLLQLVQVLKYESYLECDLVEFLLQRAINNNCIGNYFFWLLRSEMHVKSVSVRFGLILEAYCHGNLQNLSKLTRQVDALSKLKTLTEIVKKQNVSKEKGRDQMRDILSQGSFHDGVCDWDCPMDPAVKLYKVVVEKCKFMDSKMRPLWMVWQNKDQQLMQNDEIDVQILYKKGDDLRQDMLTLQILQIMDNIWQSEGMDLRLNAYKCLATGEMEGLVGVVTNSDTMANIQKRYANPDGDKQARTFLQRMMSAFNKHAMYRWLQEHNTDEVSMESAMEQFTYSCAGYCVATYVLGVGDRHSDNIMLKSNGQLFHIDFGHILGHFKSKLGVKRERAPFILTPAFVYIIKRGPKQQQERFDEFKKLCENAYLTLRRRTNLLITLFMMMMHVGLPEVSSVKDIEFLCSTLVPDMNEAEALAHFRSRFQDALRKWFSVLFDHAAHNASKDNV